MNIQQKRQHLRGIFNKIRLGSALLLCPVALWLIVEPVSAQIKFECEDTNKTLKLIAYPPGEASNPITCSLTNQDKHNTAAFSINLLEPCARELDIVKDPNVSSLSANQSIEVKISFLDKQGGSEAEDILSCQLQAQSDGNLSITIIFLTIKLISFLDIKGVGIRPDIDLAVAVNPPGLASSVTYTFQSVLKKKEVRLEWHISCPSTVKANADETFEEFTLTPKSDVKKFAKFIDNRGGADIGESVICRLVVGLIATDGFIFNPRYEKVFQIYLTIIPGIYVIGPIEGMSLPGFCEVLKSSPCDVPVLVTKNPPLISTVATFEYVYTTPISFFIAPTIDCLSGIEASLENIDGHKISKFEANPPPIGEKTASTKVRFRFNDKRGGLDALATNNFTDCAIGATVSLRENKASFFEKTTKVQVITFESRKGAPILKLRKIRLKAMAIRRARALSEQRSLCQDLLNDIARPDAEVVQTPVETLSDLIDLARAYGLLSKRLERQITYRIRKIKDACLHLGRRLNSREVKEILGHITTIAVALFENGRVLRDFSSRQMYNTASSLGEIAALTHRVELYDLTGRRWLISSWEPHLMNITSLVQQENLAAGVYLARISVFGEGILLYRYLEKLIIRPGKIKP